MVNMSDKKFFAALTTLVGLMLLLSMVFGGPITSLLEWFGNRGIDSGFLGRWFFIILASIILIGGWTIRKGTFPSWWGWVVVALLVLFTVDGGWSKLFSSPPATVEEVREDIKVSEANHILAVEKARRTAELDKVRNPQPRPTQDRLDKEAFDRNVLGSFKLFTVLPGKFLGPIGNFKGSCLEVAIVSGKPTDYVLYTRNSANGAPVQAETNGLSVTKLGHNGPSWDDYPGVRKGGQPMTLSIERRVDGTCS